MRTLRKLIFTAIGLVLAFVIGFFSSIIAFIGVGYIAFTKVSIDKLEEVGIVDIDTSGILDPSAEVSLTALTIQGLIEEISILTSMGETVTINYLIERYGLMLDDEALAHIPEDLRNIPIASVFSMQGVVKILETIEVASILGPVLGEDSPILTGLLAGKTFADIIIVDEETGAITLGLNTLLEGQTIGDVLGYEPIYRGDKIIGWVDNEGQPVTGVMRAMASTSLDGVLEGGLDFGALTSDIYIGDVLEYTPVYDESGVIVDWVDAEGQSADGIYKNLVSKSIGELSEGGFDIDSILGDDAKIGEILGYTYDEAQGEWLDENGVVVSGVVAVFAGLTFDELGNSSTVSDKINGMQLADVLGYTETEDGWVDSNGNEITGIMAVLADSQIGSIGSDLNNIEIGAVMGYELKEDGKWYNKNDEELTGVMAAFAGLSISDLSDSDTFTESLNSVKLADALGYTKTEDGWIDGNGQPVTGVMSILADTQIGSVSADMNDIQIGSVMGHEYSEADGKWYQNGVELTGVMAVFADLTINEMSDTNKVSDKMSEMFDSMTMGEYHEKGILSLDSATVTTLDTVADGWRDQSINGFIPFLISKLTNPTIPTT